MGQEHKFAVYLKKQGDEGGQEGSGPTPIIKANPDNWGLSYTDDGIPQFDEPLFDTDDPDVF